MLRPCCRKRRNPRAQGCRTKDKCRHPAMDQNRRICDCENVAQHINCRENRKTTFPPQSNHLNQVRPLLCTKLARAPVQTKTHLYAQAETTTVRTTKQRHPAHANPPELIPARPSRPGAAHRGHRHSQYPRESMGAAQQDASGQPNAPMLPQRATAVAKCALFSAPSSPAPPCKQKLIFTHILIRRRRRRSNDIQRTPIRPS